MPSNNPSVKIIDNTIRIIFSFKKSFLRERMNGHAFLSPAKDVYYFSSTEHHLGGTEGFF